MKTQLFAVACAAAAFWLPCVTASASEDVDAPPAGLAATSEHLAQILALHDAAVGKPSGRDSVIEDWRFTDSGTSGTLHLERSGTDYHSRILTGPFLEEYGQQNGQRWHRDQNGFVSATTSIDDVTFFSQQVNEDAADPKNDASVAGVTQAQNPSYVVKVQVPGAKDPEWIYYDVTSGLITRVEWVDEGNRITRVFSDFRTTGGVTAAWHVHDIWNPSALDDDYVCTSMQAGMEIAPSEFAQPQSAPFTPPSQVGLKIPATMYNDGTIIMRLTVGGRGLDMLLDTAVPANIIDETVAERMGLPTFGHIDRLPDGDVPFETLISTASVGPLTLNHLALLAMPFNFQWSWNTEIVGVLGYDFLAQNVVKIDYDTGTIEVLPSAQFDGVDPVPGAYQYELSFDDGEPFITVGIGNVTSDDVLFANEFSHTEFFGTFIAQHPDLFTGSGPSESADLPFANNGSFGRRIVDWSTQPTSVNFGSVNFQQPLVRASTEPFFFSEDRSVDAALGFDFLRFFDVYLDYPHGRIFVKPNQLFMKMIHHA